MFVSVHVHSIVLTIPKVYAAVEVDPTCRFILCANPQFLRVQRADSCERIVGGHDVAINVDAKILCWARPYAENGVILVDMRQVGRNQRSSSREGNGTIYWIQSTAG